VSGATSTPTDNPLEVTRAIGEEGLEFLVAEEDCRVAGTIMGGFDGWRGAISRLAVAADFQRQGVATALLDAVKTRFPEKGVRVVGALVEKDHPWAMAFWESADFELAPDLVYFRYRM
jgi:ribosomal protein S18 acetylase RimI-like enzyme